MAKVTLRLPDELHERLKTAATRDRRSLNAEIVAILDNAPETQEAGE